MRGTPAFGALAGKIPDGPSAPLTGLPDAAAGDIAGAQSCHFNNLLYWIDIRQYIWQPSRQCLCHFALSVVKMTDFCGEALLNGLSALAIRQPGLAAIQVEGITVPKPPPDPLLSVRAAVILLLALVTGGAAGVLGYLAHRSFPGALLIARSAAGGAIMLFNAMIGR